MKISALVMLLTLQGAVCASVALKTGSCPEDCVEAPAAQMAPMIRHESDNLRQNSVAPWTLSQNIEEGRDPEVILVANCSGGCSVDSMEATPIHVLVSVHRTFRRPCGRLLRCLCPQRVAVGCTCAPPGTSA